MSGQHRYYTDEELKARYGTHENYVKGVRTAMHEAQRDGYVLRFDEKAAVEAAKASNVAR